MPGPQAPQQLSRPELRELLQELFPSDSRFTAFCSDHFPKAANEFTAGMDRTTRTTLLMQLVDIEDILPQIERYRAKGPGPRHDTASETSPMNQNSSGTDLQDKLTDQEYYEVAKEIIRLIQDNASLGVNQIRLDSGRELTVALDETKFRDGTFTSDLNLQLDLLRRIERKIRFNKKQLLGPFAVNIDYEGENEDLDKQKKPELLNLRLIVRKLIKWIRPVGTQAEACGEVRTTAQNHNPARTPTSTSPIGFCVLHLSDMHFQVGEQAALWHAQLIADLRQKLKCNELAAVIVSGDISNHSTAAEYGHAREFLKKLTQSYNLRSDQIVLVPGNHDVDWKKGEAAYEAITKTQYAEAPKETRYKGKGNAYKIRDEAKYRLRFEPFAEFFESVRNEKYSLDYSEQATIHHFPEQQLLILGLNSAWNTDRYFPDRAGIHVEALSAALSKIERTAAYRQSLKIAVWHHPQSQLSLDAGLDGALVQQLTNHEFRLVLHGHVHRADTSEYRYYPTGSSHNTQILCAGTFGAPTKELRPGYPFQYQLLEFSDAKVIVHTRRREEVAGAWQPDARWEPAPNTDPLPRYEIALVEKSR